MNTSTQLKQIVSEVFSPDNSVIKKIVPESILGLLRRTKLWELDGKHHCPVIGVCLSIDDLMRLSSRFSFIASNRDNYAMHVEAVGWSNTRNSVSRVMQKHLDMKFRHHIITFNQAKTDPEVRELWEQYYDCGEVAGAMWASLTHKAISEKTQEIIYADVHMHSHQTGAGRSADVRRLNQLEKNNAKAVAVLELQKQQQDQAENRLRKKLDQANNQLENQHQTKIEITELQERIHTLESGEAIVKMGRRLMELTTSNEQLQVVAMRVSALEKALTAACDGATTLVKERNSLVAERNVLEGLLHADIIQESPYAGVQVAKEISVQNDCVLCVGGRTALLSQYRTLAKQQGIRLIHHDGGKEEALSRLPGLIGRANAVICPTDCVSHAAYYQLKRYCKRTNKPCLLFKGASISGFAKALSQLSSNQIRKSKNIIKTMPTIAEN